MIRGGAVTLHASDVGRAVRFYVETLGMKLVEELPDGSAVIDAGEGFRIALRRSEQRAPSPAVQLYPKIGIDEAVAILENRGVTLSVSRGEHEVVATFRDPDDNALQLVQRA